MKARLGSCLAFTSMVLIGSHPSEARDIGFRERVQAQRAIERVYFAHHLGATKAFEEAVPKGVLEKKVRTYLEQSVALERIWHTPVTSEALKAELERISRNTRFPERLREIYAALGNNAFLIQECFVRPILVERLSRRFLSTDERIQGQARRDAENLRRDLTSGRIGLDSHDSHRTLVEILRSEDTLGRRVLDVGSLAALHLPSDPQRLELRTAEFERWRSLAPSRPGDISHVSEEAESFVFRATLKEEAGGALIATYTFPKKTWEDWWRENTGALHITDVKTVASPSTTLLENPPSSSASTSTFSPGSCIPPDTWDNGVLQGLPRPESRHSMVWTGNLVIVWGGIPSESTNLGARYDPLTDSWTPVSSFQAPSARAGHTAVWTGSRMIVWGGVGGPTFTGPWPNAGGQYDPVTDSWTPTSTVNAPPGRENHIAVWTGTLMVVWGGRPTGTGGRYDPSSDTWLPTSGPSHPAVNTIQGASAVWTGTRVIIWGGYFFDGMRNVPYNLGIRYDPSTDTQMPTSTVNAPAARAFHTAVWTGGRMVIWGGSINFVTSPTDTGGQYDPTTDQWTSTSLVNAPSPRAKHSAVWTGNRMIVWGGFLASGGQYDPATDTWSATSTLNAPEARAGHTAIWTGSLMVVWGGSSSASNSLDTGGRYDPASDSWTPTASTGQPSYRVDESIVWTGNLMVVWGGHGANGPGVNTGGRYDPLADAWTPTSLLNAPAPRFEHTAIWSGTWMVVWGGSTGGIDGSGGRYDPVADTWEPTSTINIPPGRRKCTSVWTGSRMIVWGCGDFSLTAGSGGQYDPETDTWTPTSLVDAPAARINHTAVWTGDRMIIWGGSGLQSVLLNTGGQYDPLADSWTPTALTNAPSGRFSHQAVWTGSRMIVWGGTGVPAGSQVATGGQYDPVTDTWMATSLTGAPSARTDHAAVWTGSRMVVWGGFTNPQSDPTWYDTGGRYDPVTDTWSPTSTVNAPSPRGPRQAVWTGSFMMFWGEAFGSGGRYAPHEVGGQPDSDGDGYTNCSGDCNEGDPAVHPGAVEVCNGIDDNCSGYADEGFPDQDGDGLASCIDCDDHKAGSWFFPVEVTNFWIAAPPTDLNWDDQAQEIGPDTGYDIDSGTFSLTAGFSFSGGTCILSNGPGPPHTDTRANPATGTGYWYLIRAENPCGNGTYGFNSAGTERVVSGCH